MNIFTLPALSDNYMYLIALDADAIIVDPSDADIASRAIAERGLTLKHILITHHHYDHVGGGPALKRRTGAEVIGPNDQRIPALDRFVQDGDAIVFGDSKFLVMETPGHGSRDVSYLLRAPSMADALFCGDTLFVSGCGRLLEGNAETMWGSLQRIATLPDDTEVYCGHEYTEENLQFALSLVPDDAAYQDRLRTVHAKLQRGEPTVPTTIGMEKKANPFLRCNSVSAFAKTRAKKDRFG